MPKPLLPQLIKFVVGPVGGQLLALVYHFELGFSSLGALPLRLLGRHELEDDDEQLSIGLSILEDIPERVGSLSVRPGPGTTDGRE